MAEDTEPEFETFQALTQKLLKVPKREVDDLRKQEQDKTAKDKPPEVT